MIKIDKKNNLLFAPLQGITAKENLNERFIKDLNSMALIYDNKIYTKSTAIIKALQLIGGLWYTISILLIIPTPLRNIIYNFIAHLRYRCFGKFESCRIPTKEEKNKILA